MSAPRISVVVPTRNRAAALAESLESLCAQTLPRDAFEVVVVDDGSTDDTGEVCDAFGEHLRLRSQRIAGSGIAAAKSLGLFLSEAPLCLFFDDDDLADPGLLAAHLVAHERHPADEIAVLGHTTWAPGLDVTPVMEYVMEIGQHLFAYRDLRHDQLLDFTHFWGGRSSCKRALLARNGVFDQRFTFLEDIELGYRLSKHGLEVAYAEDARSFMNRPLTYPEFCSRCERRGAALWLFSELHPEPEVAAHCRVAGAEERWEERRGELEELVTRVLALEQIGGAARSEELRPLYAFTFEAFRLRGVVRALRRERALVRA